MYLVHDKLLVNMVIVITITFPPDNKGSQSLVILLCQL